MVVSPSNHRLTIADYYALEEATIERNEWFDGRVTELPPSTAIHSLITTNLLGEVWLRLRGRPCAAYASNLRLKVDATGLRTYSDGSVICEPLRYDADGPARSTVCNPTILFEVLRPRRRLTTGASRRGITGRSHRCGRTCW